MALHNYGAEGMETAFGRRTPTTNRDAVDLYAIEEPVSGLPVEEASRYRGEVRALGLIALAISTMELMIETLALRVSAPDSQAAASALFLIILWSLVLVNAVLLLLRTFDDQWVLQLRRKTQRGRARLDIRGFDVSDPILWSIAVGMFMPMTLFGPGYHHQPVFYAAIVCAAVGTLALLGLLAGRVRVEPQGLRTGNMFSSFDRFIPFCSIRSIELSGMTLSIVSSNGREGSTRTRRIKVLGDTGRLRRALVDAVPEGTRLML